MSCRPSRTFRLATTAWLALLLTVAAARSEDQRQRQGAAPGESHLAFQQPDGPTCDVDVLCDGQPCFRLLMPEYLSAEDSQGPIQGVPRFIHVIKGHWQTTGRKLRGTLKVSDDLSLAIELEPVGRDVRVIMAVTNRSKRPLHNVTANICADINRLPAKHPWSNRQFIPASVPLDRDQQGRYWYQHLTPQGLQGWSPQDGWRPLHSHPEDPDPDKVDRYYAEHSKSNAVRACAVTSLDGQSLFFLVWKAPCQFVPPFWGNACMHLVPQVAEQLGPGQTASIQGMAGIYHGTRPDLTKKLQTFLHD